MQTDTTATNEGRGVQQSRPSEESPLLAQGPQQAENPFRDPHADQGTGPLQVELPQNIRLHIEQEDPSSTVQFSRDPKRLVGYLVPFPTPQPPNTRLPAEVPARFLLYTPPVPPIGNDWKPQEGEKEGRRHKVKRKWENEVREAKTQQVKLMSWKGIKGNATKAIDWGINQTKTSNLEFLNRVGTQPPEHRSSSEDSRKKKVQLEEMLLVYPASVSLDVEDLRAEFVRTLMQSKSKAYRDSVIATGLLPVALVIDTLMTVVWPFGGLVEIDAVWLFMNVRAARTSRNVTKRLSPTSKTKEDKLKLTFVPSTRLAVLERYLAVKCRERDPRLFPDFTTSPSESEVLEAIGWSPSTRGADRSWGDEQWEIREVKEDLSKVMVKGAREWDRWCQAFEKKPRKTAKR